MTQLTTPQSNPSIIARGQTGAFIYVGEMIPNQVLIHNLSSEFYADYILESGHSSWKFFGSVAPNTTASILVEWPTGKATFFNNSVANASIYVFGNGIFPANTSGEE
jgi:hypothetical protein